MKISMFSVIPIGKLILSGLVVSSSLLGVSSATYANTYYVDSSAKGNDTYNGTSATPASGNNGPWHTLGRLATQALSGGDTVILACSSKWTETLIINGYGSAGSPITVTSNNCGTMLPTIDGSIPIPAANFSQIVNSQIDNSQPIYAAKVNSPVLQVAVNGDVTHMNIAHFPDFASNKNSFFLKTTGDAGSAYNLSIDKSQAITINNTQVPIVSLLDNNTGVIVAATNWSNLRGQVNSLSSDLSNGNIAVQNYIVRTDGVYDTNYLIAPLCTSNPCPQPNRFNKDTPYFLTGNLWMLNTGPGQWLYQNGNLYVRLPNDVAPNDSASNLNSISATTLETGINLNNNKYVSVSNLAVTNVYTGVLMQSSSNVSFSNCSVSNTVAAGIDASSSTGANITNMKFLNIGGTGVGVGNAPNGQAGTGTTITNSNFQNVGVLMAGQTILSLPQPQANAIYVGSQSVVLNNSITNTNYAGIFFTGDPLTRIENNTIEDTCRGFSDCGAVYSGGSALGGGVISGNLVRNVHGNVDGFPVGSTTVTAGIYIDDLGYNFNISNNTVINADYGIQLHRANNNVVTNNQLYGNRSSQMNLVGGVAVSTTDAGVNTNLMAGADPMFNNTIEQNVFAPSAKGVSAVSMTDPLTNTSNFATFSSNTYVDILQPNYSLFVDNGVNYTPADIINTPNATLLDVPSGLASVLGNVTSIHKTGGNLLAPGQCALTGNSFSTSTNWFTWEIGSSTYNCQQIISNPTASGTPQQYMQVAVPADGGSTVLYSPAFQITQGQWYRMSVDVQASQANFLPQFVVFNTNLYDPSNPPVSPDWSLFSTTVGTSWQRITVLFQAEATGPSTLHGRAVWNSAYLTLANVEVVPIESMDLPRVDALVNISVGASSRACPVSDATLCGEYLIASPAAASLPAITFPLTLNPKSTSVILTKLYNDSDNDSIADIDDNCPKTPYGITVDSSGCSFVQNSN